MQVKSADQTLQAKKEAIQKKLGFTGKAVDGIFGVNTTTRLEFYVSARLPSLPPGANMIVSKKGLNLVIESGTGSEAHLPVKTRLAQRQGTLVLVTTSVIHAKMK
ncbi:MAG: hypothetical protein IPI54_02530 [Chitinophagaceae bacterium]|nr:hypothetical protein [Chitinophagaceae bacterium]